MRIRGSGKPDQWCLVRPLVYKRRKTSITIDGIRERRLVGNGYRTIRGRARGPWKNNANNPGVVNFKDKIFFETF